jgi:hypothetical protein
MPVEGKRESALKSDDSKVPTAVFTNSLRAWQARWKEQQPTAITEQAQPRRFMAKRGKRRKAPLKG